MKLRSRFYEAEACGKWENFMAADGICSGKARLDTQLGVSARSSALSAERKPDLWWTQEDQPESVRRRGRRGQK